MQFEIVPGPPTEDPITRIIYNFIRQHWQQ